MDSEQAASAIESLKMESPVKKLDLGAAGKENQPLNTEVTTLAAQMEAYKALNKPSEAPKKQVQETQVVKSNENDEPLLRENPQRFVLFPIQYHEVCIHLKEHASRLPARRRRVNDMGPKLTTWQ
jgi:ribonucleoside-diphosphate reductase subunit M2